MNDISKFPIEKVRPRSVFPFSLVDALATMGYGWALHVKAHSAAPLIMQFFTRSASVALFLIYGSLLTDLNPDRSAPV